MRSWFAKEDDSQSINKVNLFCSFCNMWPTTEQPSLVKRQISRYTVTQTCMKAMFRKIGIKMWLLCFPYLHWNWKEDNFDRWNSYPRYFWTLSASLKWKIFWQLSIIYRLMTLNEYEYSNLSINHFSNHPIGRRKSPVTPFSSTKKVHKWAISNHIWYAIWKLHKIFYWNSNWSGTH